MINDHPRFLSFFSFEFVFFDHQNFISLSILLFNLSKISI